jgi:hypothetical protein
MSISFLALGLTLIIVTAATSGLSAAQGSESADLDLAGMIQPIPRLAVFSDPVYDIWCGTMTRGDDGRYHLFYSRWPRADGHRAWVSKSEVAHAVADAPLGPYRHSDVALPPRGADFWDGQCTHNPTILRARGKYYLYYMGNRGDGTYWDHRNHQRIGVAVADRPEGPWERSDTPVLDVGQDAGALDALVVTNPSVTQRPDGGFLMVYKGVAKQGKLPFGGPVSHLVALSDSPTGPFVKQPLPIFGKDGAMFPAEDPFIWRSAGDDRYHAIVKDNNGVFTHQGYSLALFESLDGIDWKLAAHPLVTTPRVVWADGVIQTLSALERPQLYCEEGRPAVLFCAAASQPDRVGSFNVAIPLTIAPGK